MISRRILLGGALATGWAIPHLNPQSAYAATFPPPVRYLSSGQSVRLLQDTLSQYGYYALAVDGIFGRGTANAVLNYQRAHRLSDDAIVGRLTWGALFRSPQPAVPSGVPSETARWRSPPPSCSGPAFLGKPGTVLFADQRQRKLFVVNTGRIESVYPCRFGGFTRVENPYRADYRRWRVHRTPTGDYPVLTKMKNPSSRVYGEGAMPNSLVLVKALVYIHGSSSFAAEGYGGGSHGCLNLLPEHAETLYGRVGVGIPVHIRK